jgi:hypothetical protein
MIIQLLGVALISLLTITPTIQQNNIEQLVAPNIELTESTFLTPDVNRLYVKNQFSYYDSYMRWASFSWFNDYPSHLYTNINVLRFAGVDNTYNNTLNINNLFILDNEFYFHNSIDQYLSAFEYQTIIREYYKKTRGAYPTTTNFSFNSSYDGLVQTTNYYTYTLNGTQGQMTGRIYTRNSNQVDSNIVSITNSSISVSQNTTLQNLIQNYLIPIENLENSSSETSNNKILYYWLDTSIPLSTLGQYTRTLYARTNYGRVLNYGNFTVNIVPPDTTPPVITGPTSLSFEVGTYSLIEQILNNFYTFTDNVGIEDAYYFPVTSINTVGTFNITVYATDAAGNRSELPVTITTTAPPPTDTTPPVIVGLDTITRELGQINNDAQLANVFNITDDFTQQSAIVKTITGTRSYTQAGTYNLTLTATDIAGNVATKQFTFIINPVVIDNEPPVINSDLIVSITVGDFTDRQEILDFYTTVTDNVGLSSVLLVGDINFNVVGDYQLQIIATDTSQNQATRNILIRVKEEVILGNYNPLTDLLSGIFGGALSMIFTIGTINVLGLRLLDAMGVIILGAVLLFVYKAIKGGS